MRFPPSRPSRIRSPTPLPPSRASKVALISLVAAVVESLPVNQSVDDNLSVPGVAAFLGILFLQVAVEVL